MAIGKVTLPERMSSQVLLYSSILIDESVALFSSVA